jgi:hypothetical protein
MTLAPDPIAGENQEDFVNRCIPFFRESGRTEKEARSISNSIFNRSNRKDNLTVGRERETVLDFPEM